MEDQDLEDYQCWTCQHDRMLMVEKLDDSDWMEIKGIPKAVKLVKLVCPRCGCKSFRVIHREDEEEQAPTQRGLFDGEESKDA